MIILPYAHEVLTKITYSFHVWSFRNVGQKLMDKLYRGRSLVGDNSVNSVKYLGLSDGFPIQMVPILDGIS